MATGSRISHGFQGTGPIAGTREGNRARGWGIVLTREKEVEIIKKYAGCAMHTCITKYSNDEDSQ
jgi:hypothetical protein